MKRQKCTEFQAIRYCRAEVLNFLPSPCKHTLPCVILLFSRRKPEVSIWNYVTDLSLFKNFSAVRHVHKLQGATLSFVMSVCLLEATRLQPDRFSWKWIFENFSKSVQKITGSLNSNKISRYFAWRTIHIYGSISLNSS